VRWDSSLSRRKCQEECLRAESVKGVPRYLEEGEAIKNPRM